MQHFLPFVLVLLLPLPGLLDGSASLLAIIATFWLDSVLLAVFGILRALIAHYRTPEDRQKQPHSPAVPLGARLTLVVFLALGILFFLMVVVIFILMGFYEKGDATRLHTAFGWSLTLMVLLQVLSFGQYVVRKEYRHSSILGQLIQPFLRIFILALPPSLLTFLSQDYTFLWPLPLVGYLLFVGTRLLFDSLYYWVSRQKPDTQEVLQEL